MDRFRNKADQTFFIENVARNGLKSHFLGPKSAPFCCKNANLPNRTCFTRIQGGRGENAGGGHAPVFLVATFLGVWVYLGSGSTRCWQVGDKLAQVCP